MFQEVKYSDIKDRVIIARKKCYKKDVLMKGGKMAKWIKKAIAILFVLSMSMALLLFVTSGGVASTPTPTPTYSGGGGGGGPVPMLESLSVNIEPRDVTTPPGETINYTITADWLPKTWSGSIDVIMNLQGFGFEEGYQYTIDTSNMMPPMEYTTSFEVPENVPPTTYKAILTATADGITSTSETELTVSVPGFEFAFAIVGLLAVAYLVRRKK